MAFQLRTFAPITLLLVASVIVHANGASAQLVRLGNNVRANGLIGERQSRPRVAPLRDGGFVVVWDGPQDANLGRRGILARRFSASGEAASGDVLINSTSESDDSNEAVPAVAGLANGGFAVVWEGPYGQDGDFEGIFGQVLDSADNKVGAELRVNEKTIYSQQQPEVEPLIDGGFVVAWLDAGLLGSSRLGPMAKVYDSVGTVTTDDFALTSFATGSPTAPEIAATRDGDFVAAWSSLEKDGDGDAVVAARFSPSGAALTPEAVVNTYTAGAQAPGAVAQLADGRFVVAWNSVGQDGDGVGAVARLLDPAGIPEGTEIAINPDTVGDQVVWAVAPTSFRGFLATYTSQSGQASGWDVRVRHFTPDGIGSAPVPAADTESGNQVLPAIATLTNGHFVAAWESQTEMVTDIFFQRFCLQWIDTPTCGKAACLGRDGSDGDPLTASDALALLESSIALRSCSPCVCDTDSSGHVAATDALLVLQGAVGQTAQLACPLC